VKLYAIIFAILMILGETMTAHAQTTDGVGVDEHLGALLPLEAQFVDSSGEPVSLGDYFGRRRPVIVVFGYHSCPMLCGLIQGAVVTALRGADWAVGHEFDVVVISIDSKDSPELASARREVVVHRYAEARPGWVASGRDSGWHYLVGDARNIERVTGAAGYRFVYDPQYNQFGHPAVVLIATPSGRVARYLYGVDLAPRDVRFGLLEAAEGRSVSTMDRVLLYCVRYDTATHRYGPIVAHGMQVGGAAILLVLGSFLCMLWLRERRRRCSPGGEPADMALPD
jgi:protein SCO1/2